MTLSVSAVGAENLSYNWKKNGDDFIDSKCNGFDTAMLTINNFIPDDQGKYSCVIKNCNASIESEQVDMALGMCHVYYINCILASATPCCLILNRSPNLRASKKHGL